MLLGAGLLKPPQWLTVTEPQLTCSPPRGRVRSPFNRGFIFTFQNLRVLGIPFCDKNPSSLSNPSISLSRIPEVPFPSQARK